MMKKIFSLFTVLIIICVLSASAQATSIFVNEIHYDNSGADTNEGIEIAGHAGDDLSGWSIVLYNGANGSSYDTETLSNIIPNQQNGFGTLFFSFPTIQNGAPDGIALVDPGNTVVQFLSYEGVFTAIGGPADGLTGTDIGVFESGTTPIDFSLQLTGTGNVYADFTWSSPINSTYGAVNTGQTFTAPVPEPSTLFLLGSGLAGLIWVRKRLET
ncbi:MAG: PEP-CTERM sorting domain-containing protein [Thermodesulfobacteriota bacterium]